MKFLLRELVNPNTAILNDTQKAVLLITHVSPTPQLAYANTSSSKNFISARESLLQFGSITMGDNAVELTPRGHDMLKYHNLVDDMGELTEDGQTIMDDSEDVSDTFSRQDTLESFNFLKSLKPL